VAKVLVDPDTLVLVFLSRTNTGIFFILGVKPSSPPSSFPCKPIGFPWHTIFPYGSCASPLVGIMLGSWMEAVPDLWMVLKKPHTNSSYL
jgi:hypothetical protein